MKLLTKALIFVLVLLMLQLGVLAAFGFLFLQAEKEARAAEKSKAVVVQGTSITRHIYDALGSLSAGAVYKNMGLKERYSRSMEELEEEIGSLDNLAKENPQDAESLHAISAEASEVFSLVKEAQETLDGTEGIEKFSKMERLARAIYPKGTALVDHVGSLVEKHRKIEEIGSISQRQTRRLIVVLLTLVTASDMAFALAVVVSFSRSITKRLRIMADNAIRLPRSQELHPPVSGADEISQLDRVFHLMAKRMAEASARERTLLNKMPVGCIACDAAGAIEYINPRTEEYTGYRNDDLRNQHITTILDGFDNHSPESAMHLLNDLTDNKVGEVTVRRKDGTVFPAEISMARVFEKEQVKPIYNLIDITRRHEAERLKQEFLSIVSHDLKTPLTSIRGCLKAVLRGAEGKLDNESLTLLSSGERESARLIRLVTDLLDVARLEAGRMKLELSACSLADVFDKAVKSVRQAATDRNVSLSVDAHGLSVIADPDRIVQVLVNLLSNAIKYSPSGSEVKVSAGLHESAIKVSVEDNGRGIPAASLKTIFDRFEQIRTEDQAEGSGLGLAICKMIVESMGGTIGVVSEEGSGSRFWFILPAATSLLEREDRDTIGAAL